LKHQTTFNITERQIKSPPPYLDAVDRLLLSSLTPPNCHLLIGKSDAQIFAGLGLDTKVGRKRITNRRYILKQERESDYYKFRNRCIALELNCPENDIWVDDLKRAEPKQKQAIGVRDFGSLSPQPKNMPPTRSSSSVHNHGGTSDFKNYDDPGKFITILYSTRLN
jgi:hypothetical protein